MKRKGTFSLEYAFLLSIAAAALLTMAVYFKRALCGKYRQSADVFGFGRQYEAGKTQIIKGE